MQQAQAAALKPLNMNDPTCKSWEISNNRCQEPATSLQNAFEAFRARRTNARKQAAERRATRSPEFKAMLRKKFVETAKKYFGVVCVYRDDPRTHSYVAQPYAQKYHEPGSELYEAPIFLDW